jgi:hypothetical protein
VADPAALADAARERELFALPRLEADLPRFLGEHGTGLDALAGRVAGGEFDHAFLVRSGGSWADMLSWTNLLRRLTNGPRQDEVATACAELHERVFMGRRVLATGSDATWP